MWTLSSQWKLTTTTTTATTTTITCITATTTTTTTTITTTTTTTATVTTKTLFSIIKKLTENTWVQNISDNKDADLAEQ